MSNNLKLIALVLLVLTISTEAAAASVPAEYRVKLGEERLFTVYSCRVNGKTAAITREIIDNQGNVLNISYNIGQFFTVRITSVTTDVVYSITEYGDIIEAENQSSFVIKTTEDRDQWEALAVEIVSGDNKRSAQVSGNDLILTYLSSIIPDENGYQFRETSIYDLETGWLKSRSISERKSDGYLLTLDITVTNSLAIKLKSIITFFSVDGLEMLPALTAVTMLLVTRLYRKKKLSSRCNIN
ncbi:MAG: hypothetical protein ACTSRU_03650 [Candidatus Hodarchaeales archaeon]